MSEEKDTEAVIVGLLYEMAADGITGEQQREWRQDIAGRIQRFMTDSDSEINRSAYARGQKEGYDRGYFQGREDLLKGEPDGWCAWNEERKVWHFMSDGQALIYKTRGYKGPLTGGFRYVPIKLLKMEVESED